MSTASGNGGGGAAASPLSRRESEAGTGVIRPVGRRFCIPLGVLLLGVSILVAAAIVVPVAVLSFSGAQQTVDEILDILRANYLRQIQEKVTAQLSVAYELAQRNGNAVGIRPLLDSRAPTDPTLPLPFHDFNADLQLQYEYMQSVQRDNFFVMAGFVANNNVDFVLIAKEEQAGILCKYNVSVPYTQACQYFWITQSFANTTVTGYYTPCQAYPPYWTPTATSIGFWDADPYFTFIESSQTWLAAYSFYWNQWKGLPVGQYTAGAMALGSQMITVSLGTFSDLLGEVTTTTNSVLAIWLTYEGSLIATNKNISLLDPASTNTTLYEFAFGYTPLNVPQIFIAAAAKSLATKYNAPKLATLPAKTSDILVGPTGKAYVETIAFSDAFGFNITILLVIPEADLLGAVTSTRRKVLASSLAIAFAMLLFAAATSMVVTQPVRILTQVMVQATNMNFVALQEGYLERHSFILELAEMQLVFATMLKRFAGAIQINK
ncbi:hypothetical protein HKX48_002075, partial [Thoreauomyces humboldtii]